MINILNFAPKGAIRALEILNRNGFDAYLVGGCVRDVFMGNTPKDFDISTSATPDEVESIFSKTFPSGKEFGTITVIEDGEELEVTTFRKEIGYIGRKPVVEFSDLITEDLSRRDFRINAMAVSLTGELIDPFRGLSDIKNRLLSSVGCPMDRIKEDNLRALRAVRFASKYDFEIEGNLREVLSGTKLINVSPDRKREELLKILSLENSPKGLELLKEFGLLEQIIPKIKATYGFNQMNPHHTKDVFGHTLDVVGNVRENLRFAALMHDIGKPQTFSVDEKGIGHFYGHADVSALITSDVMRSLNFSKAEIDKSVILVAGHMHSLEATDKAARKLISKFKDSADDLLDLMIADNISCQGDKVSDLNNLKDLVKKARLSQNALSIKDLAVNGHDLMSLGLSGKKIGDTLNFLLDKVLDSPDLNTKERLLRILKAL